MCILLALGTIPAVVGEEEGEEDDDYASSPSSSPGVSILLYSSPGIASIMAPRESTAS